MTTKAKIAKSKTTTHPPPSHSSLRSEWAPKTKIYDNESTNREVKKET